jgi:hypothetical protein
MVYPRQKYFRKIQIRYVTVPGYGLEDREIEVRSPAEAKEFFL